MAMMITVSVCNDGWLVDERVRRSDGSVAFALNELDRSSQYKQPEGKF